jgi:hypothetical protein
MVKRKTHQASKKPLRCSGFEDTLLTWRIYRPVEFNKYIDCYRSITVQSGEGKHDVCLRFITDAYHGT